MGVVQKISPRVQSSPPFFIFLATALELVHNHVVLGFDILQHSAKCKDTIHQTTIKRNRVDSSSSSGGCIGNEVTVYDSKFSGGDLSSSLTHQLSLIYRSLVVTEEDGEELNIGKMIGGM